MKRITQLLILVLAVASFTSCESLPPRTVTDLSGDTIKTPAGDTLKIIRKVAPEYPAEARAARLQGLVQVQFIVKADGSVADLMVVRSAHPILDKLAVAAISQWKFSPYFPRGGTPGRIQIPLTFSLPR